MRARYLGDHDNFAAWGISFPRGVFVPVSDAHAQKKIAGNSHFEVENSDAEDVEFVETPRAERAEPVAEQVEEAPAEIQSVEVQPAPQPPIQSYPGARRGPKPKRK